MPRPDTFAPTTCTPGNGAGFLTIPHPGEYGYETWQDTDAWQRIGGANCWAGMMLDKERGIVYIPTASAAFDFWGGNRKGQNLFSDCLLALDANTGKRLWHFQTTHHDLWDRDPTCPPTLLTVHRFGRKTDAVALPTKQGLVFLFDRDNGQMLWESYLPASGFATPSTYSVGGRQYAVVACGGGKLGRRSGDAYVAFAL